MPSIHATTRTDAGLASQLRVSIAKIARRLRSERDPDNELSVGALGVLALLNRDGDQTIGQLAAHERVRPPSMTRTVKVLEDGGYVTRTASPEDGRCMLIALSARGQETLLADRRRRDAWLARQLRDLAPDERELLRKVVPILEKVAGS